MFPRLTLTFTGLFVLAVASAAGQGLPDGPKSLSDLSGPWQLFLDDFLIESQTNVARRFHPFRKFEENPLRAAESATSRGTLLPDPAGGYRKWANPRTMIVSPDGLDWTKTVKLSRNTAASRGNISVIHTPWDRGREFKMIATGFDPVQQSRKNPLESGGGRYGAWSSDGISWSEDEDARLFADDSDTGAFGWDFHRNRYFGTPKIWAYVRGFPRRCVGFSASETFDAGWPTADLILAPDEFDDRWVTRPGQRTEFYHLAAFAYESIYLGLLEVFHNTDGWKDGPIFIELVFSRDGVRWQRSGDAREPVLPLGPAGSWDSGMIKVPSHPLVEDGQVKLYYRGGPQTHGFARKEYETYGQDDLHTTHLGLAAMRKDGFASLDGGEQAGTVTTRVLANPEGTLAVNYRTNGGGWLKAAVLDAQGRPRPGYSLEDCVPLTGDSTNQPIVWKQQARLPAQPARLQFELRNASLFSFAAGPALSVSGPAPELALLYTFEGGTSDRLVNDGIQAAYFHNAVLIDTGKTQAGQNAAAARGESEAVFLAPNSEHGRKLISQTSYAGRGAVPWTYLELDGTHRLGRQFTLAAFVKPGGKGTMRLFSSWDPFPVRVHEGPYERSGMAGMKELRLDLNASGAGDFGCLRLLVHGQEIRAGGSFQDGLYHHLAVTYDDGVARLFLDGRQIGEGTVPGGDVALLSNLHVGGDPGPPTSHAAGTPAVDQFVGLVDDLLVIGRALSPEDIAKLSREGAAAFFELPD